MTDVTDPIVKVYQVGAAAPIRERPSTAAMFPAPATQPIMILGHAPSRIRASITVVSTVATDTALLGSSSSDVLQGAGAIISGTTQPIEYCGTDELWLVARTGTSIIVGVIAEFQGTTRDA